MTTVVASPGTRLRDGRYELRRRIGAGGASTVWLAHDSVLDRPVAVKLLSEAFASDEAWLARFRREARLAASLQHPNLVGIYDYDADAERPYIVMAYLPGGSLHDRLESGESIDAERLAEDVLEALACIHEAGIYHRDVKPGNVLFDAHGRACLTDFGVARPEDATSITQTGQIPGTARYMAPELWQGEPASERTDLYACGVVLSRVLSESRGGGRLSGLVRRLAAEEASARPDSAKAALDELTGEHEVATDLPAAGPRVVHARPGLVRFAPIAGISLVVVLIAVALASALGGGGESPAPADQQAAADKAAKPEKSPKPEKEKPTPATESQATPAAGTDPAALNDQGYALLQAGNPAEAVPILQQAVDAYPDGTTDLTYAYALYNLGNALYLAGRPDEAIPVLEERLQIPNQTETVKETLDAARAAAR